MSATREAFALFEQALDVPDEARAAWLDGACAGDAALQAAVRALLDADARAQGFLQAPLEPEKPDRSGEQLGAYRLDALIGSGGMGSVYRATRADGAFDKPVAIKLLAFDVADLRQRFVQERRILGQLSHANIAALLDVGSDANGAPYFVMDHIDGVPITRFAADAQLDVPARIALFLPVLDAVQTAHSQLVVHRDLKPGNVLVDARGVPKLLDFGIAKLVGDEAAPLRTRTGLTPLTPEYASPEQVRGLPVGVPSDIYSLGVLLFELVTGERPYRITDTSPVGVERAVCDSEPAVPSRLLAGRASGGNPRDLDAVLLKALAKAPRARYASCAEFAADLTRWLAGDAVIARVPTRGERLRRTIARHRFGVSVAAAATAALTIGLGIALWQAHVANVERDRLQHVNRFLTDTLHVANPSDLGRKATVLQALERARRLADQELVSSPGTAASTQIVLSVTYRALGDFDAARDCAEKARSALQREPSASLQLSADHALASALFNLGDLAGAGRVAATVREEALRAGTAHERSDSAVLLGQITAENGKPREAFGWYDLALAELPADDLDARATVLTNYGAAWHQAGDEAASLAKYREAVADLDRAGLRGTPTAITLYGNLAASLRLNGRLDEAVALSRDVVLPQEVEVYGEKSGDVVWALTNLATFEYEHHELDAMLAHARRAYDDVQDFPDDNPWKVTALKRYGQSLTRVERPAEAVPVLERALALGRIQRAADHSTNLATQSNLGLALCASGECARGAPLAREALATLLAKYGEAHEATKLARDNIDKITVLQASK